MTNTIHNVPRELLERASNLAFQTQHYPLHEELRTLLSAPSPAGVDADHVEDVRAMVPDGWLVEKMADNGVSGFIVRTPRAEGVRTCTAVFPDDDDPAHRLLAMLLASPPAKGGE